jgi:hypothetical protein
MSDFKMTPPLWVVGVVIFVVLFWSLIFALMPTHGVIRYDCRMAEISPDFPIEVKNECRKRNSGRI